MVIASSTLKFSNFINVRDLLIKMYNMNFDLLPQIFGEKNR